MKNRSTLSRAIAYIGRVINSAVSRIHPFVLLVSCLGIWLGYMTGMYVTGSFHSASRWLGAMLSCTSLITVLQMPNYRASIAPSVLRLLGTFLGALIAYVYLRLLPFSVVGMLLSVFVLEVLCMILNIYNKSRIATITLIMIMLVSQMEPESDPLVNCLLRFFESAVGVGVGLLLHLSIEKWNNLRQRLS
ncbi:MAG: FUSC family protein, partial [Alistipes sp.]|nr:FUSC family protein [Alistipes sp.]